MIGLAAGWHAAHVVGIGRIGVYPSAASAEAAVRTRRQDEAARASAQRARRKTVKLAERAP